MRTKFFKGLAATVAAFAALTATSHAQILGDSIGVQFYSNDTGPGQILEDHDELTAGVIPQNNWNSVNANNTFSRLGLQNDAGVGTSADLSLSTGGIPYFSSSLFSGGDQALAAFAYMAPSGPGDTGGSALTATFTNIPFATYNIYVYGTADNATRVTSIEVGGVYSSFQTTTDSSAWTLATGTWNGVGLPPAQDPASYALFANVTGSSVTISWISAGNSGINGIQIVEVIPEPGTVGLLALGGMFLVSRRRRTAQAI